MAPMLHRISAIAVFAASVGTFYWNNWLRTGIRGDDIIGAAWLILYAMVAMLIAALLVMFLPGFRPQDRYWGYATLGLVLGFWLQQ